MKKIIFFTVLATVKSLEILKDIEEIGVISLGQSDIIRHSLVKKIVSAFEEAEENENK